MLLCVCMCVCSVDVPYGLWTSDDALHYVVSDLLPVILMDVEGKDNLTNSWLPVLPVLTHHVLQVNCRYTHTHTYSTVSETGMYVLSGQFCRTPYPPSWCLGSEWLDLSRWALTSSVKRFVNSLSITAFLKMSRNITRIVFCLTCLANRKLHLLWHNDLKQGRGKVDDLVGLKHTSRLSETQAAPRITTYLCENVPTPMTLHVWVCIVCC